MSPASEGGGYETILKGLRYALPRIIAKPISAVFSAYLGDLYIHTFEWRPKDFGLVTSIYSLARSISYMALGSIFFAIIDKGDHNNDREALKTSRIIAAASVALHAWQSVLGTLRMCLINLFNILCRRRSSIERTRRMPPIAPIMVDPGPSTALDPSTRRIGCFNTRGCNAFLGFIRSNLFVIILFAVIHGIGLSSYELSNRAMPTYIEKDDNNLKTMTSINLAMYSSAYLLTIMIISLIKYFFHHVISDTYLFTGVATFFMLFQFAIWPTFLVLTCSDTMSENEQGSSQDKRCCCCKCTTCTEATPCPCCASNTESCNGDKIPKPGDWCQLVAIIILHGSINFWLSTPGPVAQYVSTYIHDGNNTLKNFGPFVLLGFDTLTAVGYTLYSIFVKEDKRYCKTPSENCTCPADCCCKSAAESTRECSCRASGKKCCCSCCKKDSDISFTDKILTAVSIACQVFIYMLFYRFDYWWNKNSWFNFALFAICGGVYGLYLINATNMLNSVVKKECFKRFKWIIIGSMLFFMYFTTSIASFAMYKVYDKDKVVNCACSCIRLACTYSFTGVYKGITLLFQILNVIAASAYIFVPQFT